MGGSATLQPERLSGVEFEEELQLTGKEATGSLKVRIARLPPTMDRFPEALAAKIRLMAHAAMRWSTAQLRQRATDADAAYTEMDTVQKELVEIGALDAPTCHQLLDMGICAAAVTVGEIIGLKNLRELRETSSMHTIPNTKALDSCSGGSSKSFSPAELVSRVLRPMAMITKAVPRYPITKPVSSGSRLASQSHPGLGFCDHRFACLSKNHSGERCCCCRALPACIAEPSRTGVLRPLVCMLV